MPFFQEFFAECDDPGCRRTIRFRVSLGTGWEKIAQHCAREFVEEKGWQVDSEIMLCKPCVEKRYGPQTTGV